MTKQNILHAGSSIDPSPEIVSGDELAHGTEEGTDWARLAVMTGEEAHQNALNDPDSQPLTPELRARLRRVPNPRDIRGRMGLTQEQFARRFEIALGTLRDWEQGVRIPDSTAKSYLRVIERNPDAVVEALAYQPEPSR